MMLTRNLKSHVHVIIILQTPYGNGELVLTSHRLLWSNPGVEKRQLCLPLQVIVLVEAEAGGFTRSPKLVLHLSEPQSGG